MTTDNEAAAVEAGGALAMLDRALADAYLHGQRGAPFPMEDCKRKLRTAIAAHTAASAGEAAPQKAEHVLARAGVFAGHEGLRRFAECDEFWDQQHYGTRLYFGSGGFDYLHRGVLCAAIAALDETASATPPPPAAVPADALERLRNDMMDVVSTCDDIGLLGAYVIGFSNRIAALIPKGADHGHR